MRFRTLAFWVMVGAFYLTAPAKAETFGCTTYLSDGSGYDIVCDDFPDNCQCPDQWQMDSDCFDWCWNYGGQHLGLGDAWCSNTPSYQCELACSCGTSN